MPFGHPGISAYEYAGVMDRHNHEERAWAKAAEQTSVKRTTTESERRNDASLVVAKILELQQTRAQAQAQSDESVTTQRRRGTFVNHTPRNYEVHFSTNLARRPESSESAGHLYRAHRGSSDDKTNAGIDHNGHHPSYGSLTAGKRRSFTPVGYGLDVPLNPLIMHPMPAVPIVVPKQRHSRSSSAATSTKSSQTGLSKRSLRNFLIRNTPLDVFPRGNQPASSEELAPTSPTNASKLPPETANSKRRRRQTPYMMPKPFYTGLGRHAPLEPLVLRHRLEVTGSDVDALPPHVDVGNESSEAATLLAINEYFDSQESSISGHRAKESDGSFQHPAFGKSSVHTKEDSSPTSYTESSEHEEPTSSHSKRNSKRLSWTNSPFSMASRRRKSASELSMQSDFTSAAKGQYSPYDEHFEAVPKILKRVSVALSKGSPDQDQDQGRSVSAASSKLAPRIPRHDELTNTSLNDFNSFLRVTGPEPTSEAKSGSKKKKKGLRVIQVRSRKDAKKSTGRPRTGSNASMLLHLPSCAQPKMTSFGTKHVEIVPKMKMDVGAEVDQIGYGPTANDTTHKHGQTKVWTEEMLQPLGSSSIEHAIDPVSTVPSTTVPRSPLRSAKPAARSPRSIPVENHPLLPSRQEQTRSRKLRDLKKAKEKVDTDEDKREVLHEKVAKLESLVDDLAEALAYSAGLNARLTPEEVLEAWTRLGKK